MKDFNTKIYPNLTDSEKMNLCHIGFNNYMQKISEESEDVHC